MLGHLHNKQRVLLFGVGLVLAVIGWLFTLQKVAEDQKLAAAARVKQLENALNQNYSDAFEKKWRTMLNIASDIVSKPYNSEIIIRDLTERTGCSGVLIAWPNYSTVSSMSAKELEELRDQYRKKTLSVEHFLTIAKNQSSVHDGRDALAMLAKAMLQTFPYNKDLEFFIRTRAIGFAGPILRPEHRLFLIQGIRSVQDQYRIHLETICDQNVSNYEIIRISDTVSLYWTSEDLAKMLENQCQFLKEADTDTIKVKGLNTFPHLKVSFAAQLPASEGLSARFIAIISGLLMLLVAMLAIYLGRRDSRLARLKTELASSMAHELRTPLAGQRLLLDSLISNENLDEDKRKEYLQMIHSENKRLSQLAEEFLTFSRLRESGDMLLRTESVSPNVLLEEVAKIFLNQHPDVVDRFQWVLSEAVPEIEMDKTLIATALLNLLDNALKYGGEELIHFSLSLDKDSVHFIVRDHGEGISSSDQKRIFDNFYRVDQLLTRKRDGIGLGLAIVKRVAHAHGGEVSVKSSSGQGSIFTLSLPKS